jgi:3-oxoacyl-(acyl-carrier-protein) synthase
MKSRDRSADVWVTGIGVASCAGVTPEELWQSAQQDKSGIRNGLGYVTDEMLSHMMQRTVGSWKLPLGKALLMPTYALSEALSTSDGPKHLTHDDGIILATTTGQITVWDKALIRFLRKEISGAEFELAFQHQPLGSLLEALMRRFSFSGRNLLVTSACSAATQAIALGCQWINQGLVKRCFVGGSEILCDLTINGFKSLQLLSEQPASPFDLNRSGINLSEGAGFLCLSGAPGPSPLARISGSGMSSDSHHMTAPHPDGLGSLRAMQEAIEMASLKAADISWVHAHGTGSKHNDLAEAKAILQLFGEKMPWVSSTKWVHGHALGASGAIETILCIQALKEEMILRTGGLNKPDPEITLRHPPHHLKANELDGKLRHILKNTLGFGGVNASLVISRADLE